MMRDAAAWQWSDVDAATTAAGTQLTHRPSKVQLVVQRGRLVGSNGYATATAATRRTLARVGAMVRLREKGRYLVHAAGAVDPSGRGWLLSGDSGAGKSTLAYALSRSGWTILGDDGVLIELRDGAMIAHAWKDPLHVSSTLAPAFPELHDHSSRAASSDARQRIPMQTRLATTAPLAGVVLVERASALAVTKLGALEALAALIRQSPWVLIDDAHARAHLDVLRRTAALACFRLHHTPAELHTVARIIEAMDVA